MRFEYFSSIFHVKFLFPKSKIINLKSHYILLESENENGISNYSGRGAEAKGRASFGKTCMQSD